MRWAYIGIVRPMISYGAVAWSHSITTKKHLALLNRLDRLALLGITQTAPSVPTRGLSIAYDVLPLHLHLKRTAIASYVRLPHSYELTWDGKGHTLRHGRAHRLVWHELAEEWSLPRPGDLDGLTLLSGRKSYRVITDSFSGDRKFLTPAQYNIFSDGSKINNRVGSGAAVYRSKTLIRSVCCSLPEYTSVFLAEVHAIRLGVEALMEEVAEAAYVKIFVDSRAALQALGARTFKSASVARTHDALNRLAARGSTVSLSWIKAHVNHVGNEQADRLAKAGSQMIGPPIWVGQPSSLARATLEERVMEEWSEF